MRPFNAYLVAAAILVSGCNASETKYDTELSVVIDNTDPLPVYPTAEDLTRPLGLDRDIWQGRRITIEEISDKDISGTFAFTLDRESELSGNAVIRNVRIRQFVRRIDSCLKVLHPTERRPQSIIYRTIARQCNRLSLTSAPHKQIAIFSNLLENAELDFYDRKTIDRLRANPQEIEARLAQEQRLGPLNGLDVWLIYQPADYAENRRYMAVANFYRHMLASHGATVHIGNKFLAP